MFVGRGRGRQASVCARAARQRQGAGTGGHEHAEHGGRNAETEGSGDREVEDGGDVLLEQEQQQQHRAQQHSVAPTRRLAAWPLPRSPLTHLAARMSKATVPAVALIGCPPTIWQARGVAKRRCRRVWQDGRFRRPATHGAGGKQAPLVHLQHHDIDTYRDLRRACASAGRRPEEERWRTSTR